MPTAVRLRLVSALVSVVLLIAITRDRLSPQDTEPRRRHRTRRPKPSEPVRASKRVQKTHLKRHSDFDRDRYCGEHVALVLQVVAQGPRDGLKPRKAPEPESKRE